MNNLKTNQNGFSQLGAVLIAAIIIIITGIGYYLYQSQSTDESDRALQSNGNSLEQERQGINNGDGLKPVDPADQPVVLGECNDILSANDKPANIWSERLEKQDIDVYSITQACTLSNHHYLVTFKVNEMRLPPALAVFDDNNNYLRHTTFDCRGLGGEGAHMFSIKATGKIADNEAVITADCRSGHICQTSSQIFHVQYDNLDKELIRDEFDESQCPD